MQAVRRAAPWRISTFIGLVALALLPVVPMPNAGGTPFAVTLVGVIIAAQLFGMRGAKLDGTDLLLVTIATLLLLLELVTVMVTNTAEDVTFAMARSYWVVLLIVAVVFTNTELLRGNFDFIFNVLWISLVILLVAMLAESLFYPTWETGRQFGPVQLPIPRATGVPNSDGKLGTFQAICLCVALFYGKWLPRWKKLILLIGPFLGLFFTQSRSGLLALLIVLLLYWIYRSLISRNAFALAMRWFLLIAAAIAVFYSVGDIILNLRGQGVLQRNVDVRQDLVSYALETIVRAPILGGGADAIREYSNSPVIHNTILAMTAKSGLLAGALMAAIVLYPAMALRGDLNFTFFKFSLVAGFVAEHMLYPGFVNEFLIIAYITAKWVRRLSLRPSAPRAPSLRAGEPLTRFAYKSA